MTKRLLPFLLLSGLFQVAFAQNGIYLSSLPQLIHSQWYQPAYLNQVSDSTDLQIGVDGLGYVGNNGFSLAPLLQGGNYLTNENKDKMLGQMGNRTRFQYGADFIVSANVRTGAKFQGIYLGYHTGTSIGVNNKDIAGLVFKGNAHYENQTIADKNDFYRNLSWAEIGWGTSGKTGTLSWGLRLKALGGFQSQHFALNNIATFTATDGEEITLDADYNFYRTPKNAGLTGGGIGIDLGATMPVNDKILLSASILNAGMMVSKGETLKGNVSVKYSGFDLLSLASQDSNYINNTLDSVKKVIFPDTIQESRLMSLPTVIHLNAIYSLNENSKISAGLHYGFTQNAYTYALPMLSVGYQYKLPKILTVGANAYAGGTDTYGVGAFALAEIRSNRTQVYNLYLQSENLLGILGGIGKGGNVQAGVSVGF